MNRTIPTRVGRTTAESKKVFGNADHPHAGGENSELSTRYTAVCEVFRDSKRPVFVLHPLLRHEPETADSVSRRSGSPQRSILKPWQFGSLVMISRLIPSALRLT